MPHQTINYNQIASDYAQHRRVHPEVLKNLLEAGGIMPATKVLEIGCGTGNYSLAIREAADCASWGIDPSAAMLAQAKKKAAGSRQKAELISNELSDFPESTFRYNKQRPEAITFQLGRAEALDFSDGYFDLLFSVDVIHHVQNQARYFKEAYRVLKPGGKICTVTDSEAIIQRRQPLSVYFPESIAVELKRYPRLTTLRKLMAGAGFNRIEEIVVELAYPLADIQAYRDKAFSSLHLISEAAFKQGIARMEQDLQKGPIQGLSLYVMLWGERN